MINLPLIVCSSSLTLHRCDIMNRFDHLNISLSGRRLIEASAGTGKTYAIACLYVRLVVEQGLSPEEILVVTFTEAATKELKGRIRTRLREALATFFGQEGSDPFLAGLLANSSGLVPEPETAISRLDRALRAFDLAAIFTIHGFCLRSLQENAFESGLLYDTELVTDQGAIIQEVVDDFWRQTFFSGSAPLLGYALRKKVTPESLATFLRGMPLHPNITLLPVFGAADGAALEEQCQAAFQALQQAWSRERGAVEAILLTDKGLSRAAQTYRPDLIPGLMAEMDSYLAGANPFDLSEGFDRFCTPFVVANTKKRYEPPCHPLFDQCQALLELVEERLLAFKASLVAYARERLPARKRELNVRCFDDLLTDLHGALNREGGERLAERIRGRYRAALIDEFQDTDPVQYDIFRTIYGGIDAPLFLIGDPKQAIYSFRGADIFAYLEAAADLPADARFTLETNWRSTPGMLRAFNGIFSARPAPFLFDDIVYHPVTAGKEWPEEPITLSGRDSAPLQLWFVPTPDQEKGLMTGTANSIIPQGVAAEIARLLRDGRQGTATIEGRPMQPEDVAVIVRSHRQAGLVQDALRELGVPSVLQSSESLFASREAQELFTLLHGVAEPAVEGRVRAALVTDLLGWRGDDLARLQEDEAAWEEILCRFRDYRQMWLERGVMVMARTLVAREAVRGRLLRFPDGERRLTNLLHGLELLHSASLERGLGIEGLLTWLGERLSQVPESEEYQIRLETDAKAVRIVTVHVSKGLEYPVVFCPFAWGGVQDRDEPVTFHDRFRTVKDFGSPDLERHRALAQREALAENLRLFYVALTRAKYRCYLVAGKFRNGGSSPLAWLLHRPDGLDPSRDDLVARLKEAVEGLAEPTLLDHYRELAAAGAGSIALAELPSPDDAPLYTPVRDQGSGLACRQFTGAIEHDWRVASFTSFAAGSHGPELPDRDPLPRDEAALPVEPLRDEPAPLSIFDFPRGSRAGTVLHEIFERIDFASPDRPSLERLVAQVLARSGFDASWQGPVVRMAENVLATRLEEGEGGFALQDLAGGSWRAELEFFFPLRFISSERLREIVLRWQGAAGGSGLNESVSRLDFTPVRGMVRGFMDLVFCHHGRYYIADWKSNHLGSRPEDYNGERLAREMDRRFYPLQYLLYTVALHNYLAARLPGYDYASHFGGVYYLFLRGIDPTAGPRYGIFRDRPPQGLIDELSAALVEFGART